MARLDGSLVETQRAYLEELTGDLSDAEDLHAEQERKKAEEMRRAREAESEEDAKTHERRAEKSEYLAGEARGA